MRVELRGALVGEGCTKRLQEFLEEHYLDDGIREITLDLGGIADVDDHCLPTLRSLLHECHQRGKRLLLAGARGSLRKSLMAGGIMSGSPGPRPRHRSFPALPGALEHVRAFVRECAREHGLDPKSAEEFVLAVSEACTNAILHSGTDRVDVRWCSLEDCAEVVVRDRGVYREQLPAMSGLGEGGRGILLMMAMVDELQIQEGTKRRPGTTVRLVKCPSR